jgi:hypothetical protein
MTKARARVIAQAWLDERHDGDGLHVVVLDDATRTVDVGWVFFYQTTEFAETGDFTTAMVGDAPLVVDRHGHVHVTGTGRPVDDYLDELRRSVR